MVEIAGLFGSAVANRCGKENVALAMYADSWRECPISLSVLRTAEALHGQIGVVGHGTQTWPSTIEAFNKLGPFDRIVVFTDMQDHPAAVGRGEAMGHYLDPTGPYVGGGTGGQRYSYGRLPIVELPDVPIYTWDLRGYRAANLDLNEPGRYLFGGFTDTAFRLIPLVEVGLDAAWPWQQG